MKTKKRTRMALLRAGVAFPVGVMLIAALACIFPSCTKSEDESSADSKRPDTISLNATVQSATPTRGAVEGTAFPANTDNVFRVTAYAGPAASITDWSAAPYFNNIQVNSGDASALNLTPTQYYPANGDNVFFYAYAPEAASLTAGTASSAPVANYTITGQEDIMAAQAVSALATAGPTLPFTHQLMQVRFKVQADATFETGKKVSEILVKKLRTSAKLNIATGTLVFDGAGNDLSLPIVPGTKDEVTTAGTEMDNCLMFEPAGTAGTILLKATVGGIVYDDIEVLLTGNGNGQAGVSHLITLTFKRTGITPSATITDWATPEDKDIDIDGDGLLDVATVGDYFYSDGTYSTALNAGKTVTGMIYYVDAVDLRKFKVMSLEQKTNSTWSPNYYEASRALSDTNGKSNFDAIKNYFDHLTTAGLDFNVEFPAAAYCYYYTGKAGTDAIDTWYLPAKSELQYLWCAYNGVPPISWANGTNSNAPANIPAQNSWNDRLGIVGGQSLFRTYNWSSTEDSSNSRDAWSFDYSNGETISISKGGAYDTRCVRNITPPAIGDFKDGGIIYSFDVSKKKYKVLSLEQASSLRWAPMGDYELGPDGQSMTDGKANVAAMKAYATTKGVAFADTFPAAYFCDQKNTGGVTGWYLPAKDELMALFVSYKANITAIETGLITHRGTTMDMNPYYWSSTESSATGYAWIVFDGIAGDTRKGYSRFVRCVKDL